MAVADVVIRRMSHGIRYGTSIDAVWNRHTTVKNGAAATPASVVNRRMNRMWRMSSFVGDPCWVIAPGLRRDTQRTMIAVTAAKLAAAGMPPPGIPTTITTAVGARSGELGNRPALSHHQQVVVLIGDAREVTECLTHALAEGVDRRAKGVIGIQSER